MSRVRHHTDDVALEQIRLTMEIRPSRGTAGVATGVHVEVEPFGTAEPGLHGPAAEMGYYGDGAFVEFDALPMLVPTHVGPRSTAIIPVGPKETLSLAGLNPRFVRVRRHWWEFWRTRAE